MHCDIAMPKEKPATAATTLVTNQKARSISSIKAPLSKPFSDPYSTLKVLEPSGSLEGARLSQHVSTSRKATEIDRSAHPPGNLMGIIPQNSEAQKKQHQREHHGNGGKGERKPTQARNALVAAPRALDGLYHPIKLRIKHPDPPVPRTRSRRPSCR